MYCQDTVVLRRHPAANPEAGRLLKSALARHFRNQHCSLSDKSTNVGNVLSKGNFIAHFNSMSSYNSRNTKIEVKYIYPFPC